MVLLIEYEIKGRMKIKSVVALYVATQVLAISPLAQDVTKEATRILKRIGNAPTSTDVITQEDLKRKNIETITEIYSGRRSFGQ
ncbi:MAG: hypothetical protein GWP10_19475 [Nitrospiraceae bacterium]|nr:hypothetical protein [Nitrospiraceae bacterium]